MKNDHTQTELDMNTLLYQPQADQVFGEDLVFMLRVLLVDKLGFELRNKIAHGRLSDSHFESLTMNYLWATCLLLVISGHLQAVQSNSDAEPEAPNLSEGGE